MPGDTTAIVSAQAENSAGQLLAPLTVEHLGRVDSFDWLTQVVIKLPDQLAHAGDVWLRVNLRGQPSNRALININ